MGLGGLEDDNIPKRVRLIPSHLYDMTRLIASLGTIVAAASILAVGATGAFFSDTETSAGNTFTAGAIDLKIDNESYYNGAVSTSTSWDLTDLDEGHLFLNFTDLKPDDEGEDTISLHVDTNPAWACMDMTLTSDDDRSSTEPELEVDDAEDAGDAFDGELAGAVQMVWWADDGDNVLEDDENILTEGEEPVTITEMFGGDLAFSIALADSDDNAWGNDGEPLDPEATHYIGKGWCFGTMTLVPVPQDEYDSPIGEQGAGFTCDGTGLGNETQTDGVTLDITFEAVQARHNEDFQCGEPEIVRACEVSEEFASAFHDVDQGTRKNGTGILADRTDPADALGAPQSLGTPYDVPVAGSFFSLGFKGTPTAAPGGSIVVSFPGEVVNESGADLKLWEVTGGTSYPDEKVQVEVADSLAGPWTVVAASVTRDAEIDIAPVASAKYVRITDVSTVSEFEPEADGFDLDAVQALNCEIADLPQ